MIDIKPTAKPVRFKVGRGLEADLPSKYIDGFIWFSVDTGKLYIDSSVQGTLQRTCINPITKTNEIDLYKHYDSKYDFPNIGEPGYFYIDDSNGDVFLFGIVGATYTSVGIANDDTIYGGNASGGIG